MRILALILISLVVFNSCKEADLKQLPIEYDYGYFPLDSGIWREYEILHIKIDAPLNIYDTAEYFIREELGGVYVDAAGDTMRVINRYYKKNSNDNWQILNKWYAGIIGNEAIQVESNIRYLKQSLPLTLGKNWDGNIYNHIDTSKLFNCEVTQIDLPDQINSLVFDSVLKVTQREYLSNIDKYLYFEKYANNVGLIEKETVDIYAKDGDISIPIEYRVKTGDIFKQKIIQYGKDN